MQEPSLKKSVPIGYNIFLNFGSDVDIRFSCMKWEFCRLPLLTNGKYIEYPTHNTVKCQSEFFRCCASIVDPIFSRTIQEKMKVVILTTLGVELIIHFFNRLNMTQKAKFHVYWGGGREGEHQKPLHGSRLQRPTSTPPLSILHVVSVIV